ncbi:variant erythrocyte surface antigen-1 family protein [Babesia caballi]|uniref:Variant erythrocyte surface antigen-1 family protein n=1 Tax=Babesia caballi TaxID=5871 RepID=A0AAV4M1C4_BABCB|nr:variant erythrocyte surface antigen-1 family protein [Babesia caballi]
MTPHPASTLAHTSASITHLSQGLLGFLNVRDTVLALPLDSPLSALVNLSSDCPSNLKEAIGWILRVTGKDGGGSDYTRALAEAVKGLLGTAAKEVESLTSKSDGNGSEHTTLKEVLSKAKAWVEKDVEGGLFGNSPGPIGRLSDGLAAFIGYGSKGTFADPPTAGKLTGAGIAPSNMATHRLCDATIAFTIGVLEGCRKKVGGGNVTKLDTVITKLHETYGAGPDGLKDVATKVQSGLNGQFKGTQVNQFIDDIGTAFDSNLKTGLSDSADNVATKVGAYLKGVFNSKWSSDGGDNIANKLQQLGQQLQSTIPYDPSDSNISQQITSVNTAIKTEGTKPDYLKPILTAGKSAFMDQLKKRNYESYHKVATIGNINTTHAKIFLGCLPFIFNNLSYFYWQCRDGGPWRNQNLTGNALSAFMQGHWFFNSGMNENMTGTSVVRNVLDKKFPELQTAASATQHKSYSDFLKNFKSTGIETWRGRSSTVTTSNYLSGLYILCSCYFQCQQITTANIAVRAPHTIREMLYFLAALQFSPQYDAFDRYVTAYFKGIVPNSQSKDDFYLTLQVADSGSSKTNNTLSAADLKSHLLSTCIFIPGALGVMQGPGGSQNNSEPWLHVLFCNSAFNFKYPRGASLFSLISNYAYALQFQVLFLYLMCSNYVSLCGWNNCTYGKEVKPNGSGTSSLKSHICPGLKCRDDPSKCNHKKGGGGTNCNHNNYDKTGGCGQSPNNSPLQAFLTDGIQGMCRQHPGSSYHLATCSGAMCHVPMGFAGNLRTDTKAGGNIYRSLIFFCARSTSPLRQLCENLGCLTKRTPRLLGDLFGFTWHLKGQLFKSGKSAEESVKDFMASIGFSNYSRSSQITPSTFLTYVTQKIKQLGSHSSSKAIEKALSLFSGLPFWYNIFMVKPDESLPAALFNLKGTDHKPSTYKNSLHNDLFSLYNPHCSNQSCGKYLMPLCFSNGATYSPQARPFLSFLGPLPFRRLGVRI